MIKQLQVGLVLVAALLLPLSLPAEPVAVSSLSDIMSAEEIRAMGLDQLSEEQRALLLQWILRNAGAAGGQEFLNKSSASVPVPVQRTDTTTAASTAETSAQTQAAAVASAASQPPQTGDYTSFGKAQPLPDEMRSRIAGSFTGWSGSTLFELENGQVWQQRYQTTWRTSIENPEVVITRHFLGLHRMEVVGTGKSVAVTRVK